MALKKTCSHDNARYVLKYYRPLPYEFPYLLHLADLPVIDLKTLKPRYEKNKKRLSRFPSETASCVDPETRYVQNVFSYLPSMNRSMNPDCPDHGVPLCQSSLPDRKT